MKKTIKKNFLKLAVFSLLVTGFIFLNAAPTLAALDAGDLGTNDAANIGLGNKDPKAMAVSVIQVILGFLALIAVIIILLGGFKWMTAAGNDDKVAEAKKLITSGIIGLVIVLASWGITSWLIDTVLDVTTT